MSPWSVLVLVAAATLFLISVMGCYGVSRPAPGRTPAAGSSHRQRPGPSAALTVEGAHVVMQRHRLCGADTCSRKRAAFRMLIEAGHAVPDARAEKYLAGPAGRGTRR